MGYDGSDAAGAACAFALWLAGKAGADTTLLHVCPDLAHAAHATRTAPPKALMAAAEHRLAQTSEWHRLLENLRSYGAENASVRCRVERGHPAGVLLDMATTTRADLILVGSTGVGTLRGMFLGSVSSQVVEHAPCSVMVFGAGRAASPAHIRSVVVGIDGSQGSLDALALAQQLAEPLDAALVLVSAYEPSIALESPTSELRMRPRKHAAELLRSARRDVPVDREVVAEAVEGRPRQMLVEACERHGPAVLVVGSRGLGGFKGLLLGSTSRWVLNHAACPVLVAHRRSGED